MDTKNLQDQIFQSKYVINGDVQGAALRLQESLSAMPTRKGPIVWTGIYDLNRMEKDDKALKRTKKKALALGASEALVGPRVLHIYFDGDPEIGHITISPAPDDKFKLEVMRKEPPMLCVLVDEYFSSGSASWIEELSLPSRIRVVHIGRELFR